MPIGKMFAGMIELIAKTHKKPALKARFSDILNNSKIQLA